MEIDTYRDGGTVHIDGKYHIDKRIGTETLYAVYDDYPNEGKLISGDANLRKAHKILSDSVEFFDSPNQLIAIANGLIWLNKRIWKIEDEEKQ